MNQLVQKSVIEILKNESQEKRIKILEIGAGTGGTTAYLLPQLYSQLIEYTFTDISPLFTTKARQKFKDYSSVNYRLLDIEKDPTLQGFKLHDYDIIIAANVIHATEDLAKSLSNIQSLLTSRGFFVLLEGVYPLCWLDLIFGLTEGWWRFKDSQIRSSYPLISVNQWQELFKQTGFKDVKTLSFEQEWLDQQGVMIAQNGEVLTEENPRNWLIFADCQGVAEKIGEKLQEQGDNYQLIFAQSFNQITDIQSLGQQEIFNHVLYLWGLDTPDIQDLSSEMVASESQKIGKNLLTFIQSLSHSFSLWLVTRDTVSVEENDNNSGLISSILWGMGKAIALEYPDSICQRIDLDINSSLDEQVEALLTEIQRDSREDQIAFRNGNRYTAKLAPYLPNRATQLTISQRGTIDGLQWQPLTRKSPQVGEVEIKISAVGLNFRDVLNALGLYAGEEQLLGCECVGEIITLGEGVSHLQLGQKVMSIAVGILGNYGTVDQSLVVPCPENLTSEEAATIPVTFLTAYYTLHHLAKIKKGDRVLIHAAAGGVGMAAIQIAQQAGAEIFATASLNKWDTLKKMGVQHIMNSRTLDFAEEIMTVTQGEGVDIVLNSLSGEFITKSLSILKDNGDFLEIGQAELTPNQIKEIKPEISYFLINMVQLCQQDSSLIQSMFKHLSQQFQDGILHPLPHQTFSFTDVKTAFRTMQQGKHIGKIVLKPNNIGNSSKEYPYQGTYVITGGLGGLGLRVSQWLIEKGIKDIVLVSRTPANSEQLKAVEAMQGNITILNADVAQKDQLKRVFNHIDQNLPPLKGLIQC
jgi:NADPH:quinone reductase-like Zn-dependent oxidoreductase/SAM-dependent methyltransferase